MLLDTEKFPLVFLREDDPGYHAGTLEAQLLGLLERGERFVLLTDHLPGDDQEHDHPPESHEERKGRTMFFKRNKDRLRQLCTGAVFIAGDRPVPAVVQLTVKGLSRAFGLTFAFARTEREALECAERFMARQ